MSVYRFIARIAVGLYILRHGWQRLTGAAKPKALAGRFGHADRPNLPGPRIWLHAASNGELASARGVINTLLNRAPDLRIILTTNTTWGGTIRMADYQGKFVLCVNVASKCGYTPQYKDLQKLY